MKKIFFVVAFIVALLSGCSPKWEDKFDIKYVGSELLNYTNFEGKYTEIPDPIEIYEITNSTDKAFHKVTVVIKINLIVDGNFSFEENLGTIQPHETKKYNIHQSKIEYEAKKNGITDLLYQSLEISSIKWE